MTNRGPQQQHHATIGSPPKHELRLQELQKLFRRDKETPGPGHYAQDGIAAFQHRGTRRRHLQALDGPFILQEGQTSTRSQQMDSSLMNKDSGLGPATYEASTGLTATRAATPKIGTTRRSSSAVAPGQVCLSLSRCLAAGLDWRQQLGREGVTLAHIQQHLQAVAAGSCQQPTSTSSCQVGPRASNAAAGGIKDTTVYTAAAAAATVAAGRALQVVEPGALQGNTAQQEQQCLGGTQEAALATGSGPCSEGVTLQQQQQQPCWQNPTPLQSTRLQQRLQVSSSSGGRAAQRVLSARPATTGSSGIHSSRCAGGLPWHLQAALQHHHRVMQALQDQAHTQQQQQQLQPGESHSPRQSTDKSLDQAAVQRSSKQALRKGFSHPVTVLMQQQQVQQHRSAARAASAVQQLAARRQQWVQLSQVLPPPYPVFLPDAAPTGSQH